MLTRRQFAGSLMGAYAFSPLYQAGTTKKKIAFVATDVDRRSHGQFFLDRYAIGCAIARGVRRRLPIGMVCSEFQWHVIHGSG